MYFNNKSSTCYNNDYLIITCWHYEVLVMVLVLQDVNTVVH